MVSLEKQIQQLKTKFKLTTVISLLLCVYSFYIEYQAELNPFHKALCDLHEKVNCTKAFNSKFGKGFGIIEHILGKNSIFNQSNSIYGIIFYVILLLLEIKWTAWTAKLQLLLSLISNFGSLYLAYILIYKLQNLCVVCISMYVFNGVILYCSYQKLQLLELIAIKRKKLIEKLYSEVKNHRLSSASLKTKQN